MMAERRDIRSLRLPGLLLAAAASGGLLYLAFPPADLGPLAWVALVPLYIALSRTRSVAEGIACGLICGLALFGPLLEYLRVLGVLPWLASTILQALFIAAFGGVAAPVMRRRWPGTRVLGGAAAWTLLAFARANADPVAFSFGDLAFTQHDQLPILQLVSVLGQLGLTFTIACVNAGLSQALLGVLPRCVPAEAPDVRAWSRRSARCAVIVYGLVVAVYLCGASALKNSGVEDGRTLEVAIVQGGVRLQTPVTPEDVEESKRTYLRLNRATPEDVDLTIWPESSLPGYMPTYPGLEETARSAAREREGRLLLGTLEQVGAEYYNAARLYDDTGAVVDRYHKMDLVVFGEYVPLRDALPFLEEYPIRKHDLTRGRERKLFDVSGVAVAPLICYEATFSGPTREVCLMGAEVIAVLSSDAWADSETETRQHSCTAPLRAVESRRYICRAATLGVSAIYSPHGETLAEVGVNETGVLAESVQARRGLSVYHRIGDLPLVIFCVLAYCLAALAKREEALNP